MCQIYSDNEDDDLKDYDDKNYIKNKISKNLQECFFSMYKIINIYSLKNSERKYKKNI